MKCDVCTRPIEETQAVEDDLILFLPPKKQPKYGFKYVHLKCEKEGRRKFPSAGKREHFYRYPAFNYWKIIERYPELADPELENMDTSKYDEIVKQMRETKKLPTIKS